MIRRKGSWSWILVWSCSLLIGGMILYVGYIEALSNVAKEKDPIISKQKAQAVVAQRVNPKQQSSDAEAKALAAKPQKSEAAKSQTETVRDFPSPVRGKILRGIGNYYFEGLESYIFHPGQDYAEPEGTVIRATHQGKVVYAGTDSLLGEKVVLDCGQGWVVIYGGLDNLRVKTGQAVEKQAVLGQVGFFPGAEGAEHQPQLHYEVWHNNQVQIVAPSEGSL
ncbi:M23 family metallopeptidase [Desulfosporosinus sp. PR]|uniref:M23 family metallopeptidase n=1 Tax=Candidatus Desulfosporosinus nitrosoreducens TaxID=3401928 RepID=UPI0027FC86B9|nr:M23 family metallopeptidase [Desulfosporosinus sp. PR]MDQ7093039.1 M23 family metallopeptidase [Desulfosporosinus sp. PR]